MDSARCPASPDRRRSDRMRASWRVRAPRLSSVHNDDRSRIGLVLGERLDKALLDDVLKRPAHIEHQVSPLTEGR